MGLAQQHNATETTPPWPYRIHRHGVLLSFPQLQLRSSSKGLARDFPTKNGILKKVNGMHKVRGKKSEKVNLLKLQTEPQPKNNNTTSSRESRFEGNFRPNHCHDRLYHAVPLNTTSHSIWWRRVGAILFCQSKSSVEYVYFKKKIEFTWSKTFGYFKTAEPILFARKKTVPSKQEPNTTHIYIYNFEKFTITRMFPTKQAGRPNFWKLPFGDHGRVLYGITVHVISSQGWSRHCVFTTVPAMSDHVLLIPSKTHS